ncbi:MAG: MCE family protein [FCB group bacterium]|nr:MCE family protein [FCB group bacterium]
MSQHSAELKIGITSFIALVILTAAIILGKDIRLSSESRNVTIHFPNVIGLENGARVLVNGLDVGKAVKFNLIQDGVLVEVSIDKNIAVFRDARAVIETPELMGQKVIALSPGRSGESLEDNGIIRGHSPMSYAEVFDIVERFAGKIESIMTGLLETTAIFKDMFHDTSGLYLKTANVIDNLYYLTITVQDLIDENRSLIDNSIENVDRLTANLDNIVESNKTEVDTILYNLSALSGNLLYLSNQLTEITESLNSEQGTIGRMIHDDEMYYNLLRTVESIDSLTQMLMHEGIKARIKIF